ncbi:MAG: hypothetical protein ACNA8P_12360, partial [Phycisphaerales bacterium]
VPYNHSNLDSDEVLYYVEGNFGSRKGIDIGSFTCHPQGIPHGPHPGTIEASMKHDYTAELAVMVDTFRPLYPTKLAIEMDDPKYPASWEGEHFPGASNSRLNGKAGKPRFPAEQEDNAELVHVERVDTRTGKPTGRPHEQPGQHQSSIETPAHQ